MFIVRWPEDFVPEECGWEPVEGQTGMWLRWEIPFQYPASLSLSLREGDKVGGWFGPPEPIEELTLGELHAMMLGKHLAEKGS